VFELAAGRLDGLPVRREADAPALPVAPALAPLLPGGLRRGGTVAVGGQVSLVLALLGAASARGSWCGLVGLPRVSAEALRGYRIDLRRVAFVPSPDAVAGGWLTAVGALLDAMDIVAVRSPQRLAPGDARRLAARARSKGAVLIPFTPGSVENWPGAEVRLTACGSSWHGPADGYGRLRARRVEVCASGRGRAARPRSAQLWLPGPDGGVDTATPLATVVDLGRGRR